MLVTLDPDSPLTLHDQLVAGLRGALARGEITPGERLPPARELAAALEVNVHTVLRAYGRLRDDGLIQMRRGRGAVVVAPPDTTRVRQAVAALLEAGRLAGLDLDDLHRALDEGAAS